MSKTRKILSVVLALAMVFATLAVTASAAYYYEDETSAKENTQVWTLGTPVDTGDGVTYTVDVSLTTNYPTGTIQFVVNNTDNTNVALTGVTVGAAIPATYNAAASYSNTTGKVIIVPQTALNSDSITATAIDGVVATLTYTYSGTGGATINIEEAPKSETDTDGSLIAARISDGDLVTGDLITGQTATFVTNEQTIGSAVVNTLVLLSDEIKVSTAYCNTDYIGVICGFSSFNNVSAASTNLSTTLGKEYLNIVCATGTRVGTGSVVQVLDADKTTVLEEYVVAIFGDIDGNGRFSGADISALASAYSSINSNSQSPLKIAGNCDANARVNGTDVKVLAAAYAAFGSKQVELAEKLF